MITQTLAETSLSNNIVVVSSDNLISIDPKFKDEHGETIATMSIDGNEISVNLPPFENYIRVVEEIPQSPEPNVLYLVKSNS